MLARSFGDGRGERRFSQQLADRKDSNIVVSRLLPPHFWASPSPWTTCRPKIWAHSPCFSVIVPYSECSFAFSPHNNWPAVYPSVDWICEARCACTHLFAPFIWNQIVLLMLICTVMLATVRACNRSPTHKQTHTYIVKTLNGTTTSLAFMSTIILEGVGVNIFKVVGISFWMATLYNLTPINFTT